MEGGLAPAPGYGSSFFKRASVFPEQLIATLPAHEALTLHRQPDRARRQSSRVHPRKEACKTSQDSPGSMPPGRRSPQVAARQCARRCDGCWNTLQTLSCGRKKLARRVKSFPPSQAAPCKSAVRAQDAFRQYQPFAFSLIASSRISSGLTVSRSQAFLGVHTFELCRSRSSGVPQGLLHLVAL